ncbi:GGDEF domain-containing protein [Aureimonas sp. N4]|uniref:GGDEF domain-containing protein n=1 Tax=Aureimonas sp. N4 TaxID=1638165 RepID=UPI000A5B39F2|nr:sensor domain-containing diguanylate cyclase [Aureimonas sp. N4]
MQDLTPDIWALLGHTQALIGIYDPSGRLVYANDAFCTAFFIEPGETPLWCDLMRRNYHAGRGVRISHPCFEDWLQSTLSRRGKVASLSAETDLLDGRWLWIVESTMPDGFMLFVGTDITRQRCSQRELRQERDIAVRFSQTDPLTSISNRRHIMDVLETVLTTDVPLSRPLGSLCILDIDLFKTVNDRFGHVTGDSVLVDVARTLRAGLRTCDALGRLGGEEFMVILPGVGAEAAQPILNRLLSLISHSCKIAQDPDYVLTCSAGATELQPGERSDTAYSRADRALYDAKRGGRNRLMLAS